MLEILGGDDEGNENAEDQRPEGGPDLEERDAAAGGDQSEEGADLEKFVAEGQLEGLDQDVDHREAGENRDDARRQGVDETDGEARDEAEAAEGQAVDDGGGIADVGIIAGSVGGADGRHRAGDVGVVGADEAGDDAADAGDDRHHVDRGLVTLGDQDADGLTVLSADDEDRERQCDAQQTVEDEMRCHDARRDVADALGREVDTGDDHGDDGEHGGTDDRRDLLDGARQQEKADDGGDADDKSLHVELARLIFRKYAGDDAGAILSNSATVSPVFPYILNSPFK